MLGAGFSSDSSSDDDSELSRIKEDPVQLEVYNYKQESKLPFHLHPLKDFWKMQSGRFPLLSKLTKTYLAMSATSTQAERAFSKLGLLLTKRRLALDGEKSIK